MKVLRLALLVSLLAFVGIAGADTAAAADTDDASGPDGVNFRICAPPVEVGPVAACSIEI